MARSPHARLARVVVPGIPHHVTQRGNRRPQTSFADGDYAACRDQLAESCMKAGVAVWAWCLMPNHVHLILVPGTAESLRAALADAHRRYSRRINFREGWRGYPEAPYRSRQKAPHHSTADQTAKATPRHRDHSRWRAVVKLAADPDPHL